MKRSFRPALCLCLVAAVLCLAGGAHASAYDSAGDASAVFLREGQGARALALGGAYTAVGRGVSAVFWNPGGMPFGRKYGATLNYNTLIDGMSTQSLAFLMPVGRWGALSVNGLLADLGTVERRDGVGNLLGDLSLQGRAYGLGYGVRVGSAGGLGIQVKSVEEDLGAASGKAVAVDLGALWAGNALSLGASAHNIGGKYKVGGRESDLSQVMRVGGALRLQDTGIPHLDRFTLSLDGEQISDQDIKVRTGLEGLVSRMLTLRAGYEIDKDQEVGSGLSFGLGLWTDFQAPDFTADEDNEFTNYSRDTDRQVFMEFDYAYLMQDTFDDLHRVTLTLHF